MHPALSPYLRLMRLHQPVGIWLLLWPCCWSIALAANGTPPLSLLALFALGAVTMRSAGCIINDMADREFDRQVERTQNRPLASGELSMRQAGILLAILLLIAAALAFMVGPAAILWGALSLIPVAIYPFMKRISWWPQLFLGLTFNWGALMGWAAVRGGIEWPAILLYTGGIFWTLGYDTIYAHQDKADDARIGVKSTALRLGLRTKPAVALFYAAALFFWAIAGANLPLLLPVAAHSLWQVYSVDLDTPSSCRRAFKSNAWLGALVFLSFLSL